MYGEEKYSYSEVDMIDKLAMWAMIMVAVGFCILIFIGVNKADHELRLRCIEKLSEQRYAVLDINQICGVEK